MISDGCQTVGKLDIFKTFTAREGVTTDVGDALFRFSTDQVFVAAERLPCGTGFALFAQVDCIHNRQSQSKSDSDGISDAA